MWSVMSHKSSSITSALMAEKDEALTSPLHLIHVSICLLSMPLSKDYWCSAFDIWHIMCHNISSSELTCRGQKKTWLPSVPRITHKSFLCVVVLDDIVTMNTPSSPAECYLTFAGLHISLPGSQLTCQKHSKACRCSPLMYNVLFTFKVLNTHNILFLSS